MITQTLLMMALTNGNVALTSRWTHLERIKPVHEEYFRCDERFIVVPAGRRSYKTEIGKRKLVIKSMGAVQPNAWFIAAAPTRDQAKRIFWADLKAMIPRTFVSERPNETDLTITLLTGTKISVVGMDRPERVEGNPVDGILLDEYGNMKPEVWPQHVRPALSDPSRQKNGSKPFAWFIGVPEGRNHYYDLWLHATHDMSGEWARFTWKSSEVIDPEELEVARHELDQLTYEQEYEASFVSFSGRVYHAYGTWNVAPDRLPYDPEDDLFLAFDFNISPGCAAVIQEGAPDSAGHTVTRVIGEVWIPRNSNTESVCRKIIEDWGNHKGMVYAYGDATGGARGSAKVMGSDWDLIENALGKHFGGRFYPRVPRENPPVRARINAMNSRLKTASGDVRLLVDPQKAPHVIKDFEGVVWKEGAANEIDKDKTKYHDLTHISDAVGYYMAEAHPIRGHAVTVETII